MWFWFAMSTIFVIVCFAGSVAMKDEIKNSAKEPCCTIFGPVFPDDWWHFPFTVRLHEWVHWYTLFPYTQPLVGAYAWMFFWDDNPWYMAFIYGSCTALGWHIINEAIADIFSFAYMSFLSYPDYWWRDMVRAYQNEDMPMWRYLIALPMYPPWRIILFIYARLTHK